MWGYDFRPAYADLGNLSNLNCPIVAMTGTCTARTEEVISKSLNLSDFTVVRQSCDRENISLFVKHKKSDGKDQVVTLIQEEYRNQCGIVYCLQRGDTTDMAYLLQSKGINATYYHFTISFLPLLPFYFFPSHHPPLALRARSQTSHRRLYQKSLWRRQSQSHRHSDVRSRNIELSKEESFNIFSSFLQTNNSVQFAPDF